jgi:hypothetical protein
MHAARPLPGSDDSDNIGLKVDARRFGWEPSPVRRRIRRMRILLLSAVCVIAATPAVALDFSLRGGAVHITGPVRLGDNVRFDDFMRQPGAANARVFHLNSPGGTIGIALHIAREIRKRGGATVVNGKGFCESACTVMFAGGATRHYINTAGLSDRLDGARGGLGFHEGNNANSDGRGVQYSGGATAAMINAYYELGARGAPQFATKAGFRGMYRISGATALQSGIATSLSPP